MTVRPSGGVPDAAAAARGRRSFWLRQFRYWHWVSSAICLVGMLGFAITGITLNHASTIRTTPVTDRREAALPAEAVAALARTGATGNAPLPESAARAIGELLDVDLATAVAEWSDDEIYVPLPQPGGDAFVAIDRASGRAEYEETTRGWIAYLNDLHKGRNTGRAWSWFLDVFAVACVIFSLTGFALLYAHAAQRRETWPAIGLGILVPVLLAMLFIH